MSAATSTLAGLDIRPTFARAVRSEWIKLRTLRSTVWTAVLTVFIMGGFAALFAWGLTTFPDEAPTSVGVVVVGYQIAQLTIAVLGVLIVSGEYATGSIRSTLAAEPRRVRVVASKALVLLGVAFLVSTVSLAVSTAVAVPILEAGGLDVQYGADDIRAVVGAVLYLTVTAWFAFGIALLVKNTAAAITTVVAILFVVPIIVQIIAATTGIEWVGDVYDFLPSTAGSAVASSAIVAPDGLEPWVGFAVFGGYTAAVLAAGTVAFMGRDD